MSPYRRAKTRSFWFVGSATCRVRQQNRGLLVDRRRVERVRASTLPVERQPRPTPGDRERIADLDDAPVRSTNPAVRFANAAIDPSHVPGRHLTKPVANCAACIRYIDVEAVTVRANKSAGDCRGPSRAARDEDCRCDRNAGRDQRLFHAGIPFAAIGSASVSVELKMAKSPPQKTPGREALFLFHLARCLATTRPKRGLFGAPWPDVPCVRSGNLSAVSRRAWLGLAAVAVLGLAFLALVVANFVYLPVLGQIDPGIHDAASLPDSIHVCGGSWSKDALARQYTVAQIAETFGGVPSVVNTRPFAACPAGACATSAGASCRTVIFVRVAEDAFVDYSLRGGP